MFTSEFILLYYSLTLNNHTNHRNTPAREILINYITQLSMF